MKEDVEQMTDEELACSSAGGDRAAFDQIVRRYTRPLADFVAARTSTFQDAEDIVQDTFLRAYTNIESFDQRYALKNWLFTIAYRLVVSAYRKKRPGQLTLKAADSIAIEPAKESTSIDWIWQAASELSPQTYTILWLRYKQDMQIDEIARIMKKTKVGVRVKLHRARKQLAAQIIQTPSYQTQVHWNQPGNACMKRIK
jgi:RNA polymerase sigma-70 factor (ECF subfamily)